MDLALSSAGHHVIKAESGEVGLVLIDERKPDIVFLDVMMPGMGGLETLSAIRARPDLRDIAVVMVSGVRPSMKKSDQKWDEFLTKPFSLADALKTIKLLAP